MQILPRPQARAKLWAMPFVPPLLRPVSPPPPWGPLQQAACEAVWRAVVEGGRGPTRCGLCRDTLELPRRIRHVVAATSGPALAGLVAREIDARGALPGGWSARWPDPAQRPAWAPGALPPAEAAQLQAQGALFAVPAPGAGAASAKAPRKRLIFPSRY